MTSRHEDPGRAWLDVPFAEKDQAKSLHHGWTTVDKLRYEAARAMAVTTYSTVFNVRPALEPAQTLLFDDAHAAEQFVAGAWSIEVNRFDQPELYQQLLEVFRPELDGVTFQLLSNEDDPTRRTVQMIGVAQMRRATPRLLGTFSGLSRSDDLYWRVEAVRDRLDRCQTYITWDAILTRPFIPPTASHRHFIAPEQRVYLSDARRGRGAGARIRPLTDH